MVIAGVEVVPGRGQGNEVLALFIAQKRDECLECIGRSVKAHRNLVGVGHLGSHVQAVTSVEPHYIAVILDRLCF